MDDALGQGSVGPRIEHADERTSLVQELDGVERDDAPEGDRACYSSGVTRCNAYEHCGEYDGQQRDDRVRAQQSN